MISVYSNICFIGVGTFLKASLNENCQGNEVIKTLDQCKDAARNLRLAYSHKFNSIYHPLGCLWNNFANTTMFNENVNGPTNPGTFGKYGGVCLTTGKWYYNKIQDHK